MSILVTRNDKEYMQKIYYYSSQLNDLGVKGSIWALYVPYRERGALKGTQPIPEHYASIATKRPKY